MRYTVEQRKFVVVKYFENNHNINCVGPLFIQEFGMNPPRKESMNAMVRKFVEHGTVQDRIKGVSGRHVEVTGPENVRRVRDEFTNYPNQSIYRASQVMNISTASIHRILKKKLLWKPYKAQERHYIPQRSEQVRVVEAGDLLDAVNNNPNLMDNIWFSDESHFELTPTVNKQNFRHWGPVQPYITIHRPLHPLKTTCWGAISANGNTHNQCKIVHAVKYNLFLQKFLLHFSVKPYDPKIILKCWIKNLFLFCLKKEFFKPLISCKMVRRHIQVLDLLIS